MSTQTSGRAGEVEPGQRDPAAIAEGSPPARCTAVAYAYHRPVGDVAAWPPAVLNAFHRNAIHRGWLITEETE